MAIAPFAWALGGAGPGCNAAPAGRPHVCLQPRWPLAGGLFGRSFAPSLERGDVERTTRLASSATQRAPAHVQPRRHGAGRGDRRRLRGHSLAEHGARRTCPMERGPSSRSAPMAAACWSAWRIGTRASTPSMPKAASRSKCCADILPAFATWPSAWVRINHALHRDKLDKLGGGLLAQLFQSLQSDRAGPLRALFLRKELTLNKRTDCPLARRVLALIASLA